ncbi:DUF6326 family protein [Pseudoalteromonas luteoviolacea]|uniref:Major facilitator superfamily (MFS) profile domain-containing protein n=1 Tax=Pseudoalteromonas luteoviolacea S4054 TaxID=1129367 RepID=A0A0F6AI03_9GAMM|nr:DUF6326 family protein [Pseudoalteromonas luteoviolacea]AOT07962.1 hypothetical protein S4054249_08950 [Pseudoalteromonas luteoviolacea]AOT12878.1 hypothetical protein S40542_08950 [Pseudoalteromonas luteoviolacea]AOT17791.1 hypothetical protein S4054_08945 [Pseudoalteromonas luteoviolacea]KKE85793.1 hypothetical protein N479_00035 [Pseudoalteromonas luteoviolacea S4054]KZN74671.1 hypothetical protein N481_08415 [Pseudoalteromonas luteoviolacea S4047-1]
MNTTKDISIPFEDYQINVKLKISALWIAVMFCYVYGDYIEVYVPGVMSEALLVSADRKGIQYEFFAVALLMSIPSVMIFLTLALKPNINRKLNIIIPSLFIVLLVSLNLETRWGFYLYLTALEVLLSFMTMFYAWKWPKAEGMR